MKSVFGFRVRLGNPDLDFENLNPDFPIERTLYNMLATLKGVNDTWKLKSITLRYIKVIWFLFICSTIGGITLKYKREVTKKVQLNFWLLLCHKKWGAFQVEIFFFKSDLFFVNHRFFNFIGLEKTKEDDVPQNNCEKDAVTDPIAGNVIVCFVTWTEDKIYLCSRVRLFSSVEPGYFRLLGWMSNMANNFVQSAVWYVGSHYH